MNIDDQIVRIKRQIESEKRVYEVWKTYKPGAFRDAVLNQALGVVKGLEVGLESLEYLQGDSGAEQLTTEEWMDTRSKDSGRLTAKQIFEQKLEDCNG